MGRSFLVFNYQINKTQIIQKHCINKNRPSKKCNGKCHLFKQLREQQERDRGNTATALPEILKAKTETLAEEPINTSFSFFRQMDQIIFETINQNLSSAVLADIFHPPLST
jgi:hypothetical protein